MHGKTIAMLVILLTLALASIVAQVAWPERISLADAGQLARVGLALLLLVGLGSAPRCGSQPGCR